MGETTGIEWTDATWNPVTGCTKVSPGCDSCYAIRETNRHRNLPKYAGLVSNMQKVHITGGLDWTGEVRCHPDLLEVPLHWKTPRRIFVCSVSDLFHSKVPWEFIAKVFDVMIDCPQHTFQLLTKRPGRMAFWADNMAAICEERGLPWPWPPWIWAGTSVESQRYAPRLDVLARVPAKVRFVSAEPLLGPLNLKPYFFKCSGTCAPTPDSPHCACKGLAINWVISGGESGPGARPSHPDWFRRIRDDCQAVGIPYFHKQNGEYIPKRQTSLPCPAEWGTISADGTWWSKTTPWNGHDDDGVNGEAVLYRVGKKAAGALLDEREWREIPT